MTYLLALLLVGHTFTINTGRIIDGYISAYSRADSCHNMNAQGECIMANGKPVSEGSIACPRNIKLGSIVEINGVRFSCNDRTAEWVQQKFPNTFDIFVDGPEAKQMGRQRVKIKIYE